MLWAMMVGLCGGLGVMFLLHALHGTEHSRKQREFAAWLGGIPKFHFPYQILGADYKTGLALDPDSGSVCLYRRDGGSSVHGVNRILASEIFEHADPGKVPRQIELRLTIDDFESPLFAVKFMDAAFPNYRGAREEAALWLSRVRVARGGASPHPSHKIQSQAQGLDELPPSWHP